MNLKLNSKKLTDILLIFIYLVFSVYIGFHEGKYVAEKAKDAFFSHQVVTLLAFITLILYVAVVRRIKKAGIIRMLIFILSMTLLIMSYTISDLSDFSIGQKGVTIIELAILIIIFIFYKWKTAETVV